MISFQRETKAYQGSEPPNHRFLYYDFNCELANPYYLLTLQFFFVVTDSGSDRLRKFLHAKIKIAKRKKQIHPVYTQDMQLEINCVKWALQKIEVNKLPNDRLEGVIRQH